MESHSSQNPITINTRFDLASLTKILATTSLFMDFVEHHEVDLDQHYPGRPFTFRQLLTHTSGLPAWRPFYETMIQTFGPAEVLKTISISDRKKKFYSLVRQVPLEHRSGEKVVYSDLGFLYLSEYVESLKPDYYFCDWVKERVWSRIEGCGLLFRPAQKEGIAATELCPWRGELQGEVHDDNCWSMGGVAGHAGVFGSLRDVLLWTRALVSGQLFSSETIKLFSQISEDSFGVRRAIGFDVPPFDGSGSTATVFSVNGTLGHLGFTGTSLWIDFEKRRFAILLTNRVHPSREDQRIRDLRRNFHLNAF